MRTKDPIDGVLSQSIHRQSERLPRLSRMGVCIVIPMRPEIRASENTRSDKGVVTTPLFKQGDLSQSLTSGSWSTEILRPTFTSYPGEVTPEQGEILDDPTIKASRKAFRHGRTPLR